MTITAPSAATNVSAPQSAGLLAILAVGSALLSNFLGYDVEAANVFGYPVLPGIYFGVVLTIGTFLWVTRSALALLIVLVATIVAWVAAFQIAMWVYLGFSELIKGYGLSTGRREMVAMAVAGLCGGLAGGLLTAATISFACKDFRSRENFLRTIIVGGLAGLLLVCFDDNKGWAPVSLPNHLQLLPLFLVWQAAVAASIGYGLVRR